MVISDINLRGIGMTSQRTRVRLVNLLRQEGIKDERVLEVIRSTPRHIFVDEALSSRAYENTALPIGSSQTISQPYTVARMTELLLGDVIPTTVLEIGTGCGYQTAILAQLVNKVYSVERISALLVQARRRFVTLDLHNIQTRHIDGYGGWEVNGPYDAIIVTAAPLEVPQALLEQLTEGGRMIIPVGVANQQQLKIITKQNGEYHYQDCEGVSFVPLLGGRV
ncbi:Protein-L-isoaspartate O-methyltransferase [hydrothermal vent metagenome]|uniref:protein-L-isoaspartate(D-aspartate) O-methyltransferase n=1 Tax=hydrothermal vent metagenome TaxID=652676 RepID=A0A3B0YP19_9ZZZZ